MSIEFSDTPLSATLLTKLFKEEYGIDRDGVLNFLVNKGYIVDIRTITPYGLVNGVTYKYNEEGSRWPVYDRSVQELVYNHIHEIPKAVPKETKERKPYSGHPHRHRSDSQPKNAKFTFEGRKSFEEIVAFGENLDYNAASFPVLGIDNFVIVDTETTGMGGNNEIVEFAVVDMLGNTLYETLFEPYASMTYGAQMVNHISDAMLIGQPKFEDEWSKIKECLRGKHILCHNTRFDRSMTMRTLEIHGGNPAEAEYFFRESYDSVQIAKQWLSASSYSLENCAYYVGIKRKELHRADDDCRMTLEFLVRLENIVRIAKYGR